MKADVEGAADWLADEVDVEGTADWLANEVDVEGTADWLAGEVDVEGTADWLADEVGEELDISNEELGENKTAARKRSKNIHRYVFKSSWEHLCAH